MSNVFAQPEEIWVLKLFTIYGKIAIFEEILGTEAYSINSYEYEESKNVEPLAEDKWAIEFYFTTRLSPDELTIRLALLEKLVGEAVIYQYFRLENWDIVQKFPPIFLGNFFIHGSDYDQQYPLAKKNIIMDAGCAFGTGEHQTTQGCITALEYLNKQNYKLYNVIDLGCGSAILAIAYAKICPTAKIIATDIDKKASTTARQNVRHNQVKITSLQANMYYKIDILKEAPFDLIIANILARPLLSIANISYKLLNNNGFIILSGFTTKQQNAILNKYSSIGFRLYQKYELHGWITMILAK